MPKRIQRQRVKGWRMPEGVVYVGRPTIFGNPFWHAQKFYGVDTALALFREMVSGSWSPRKFQHMNDAAYGIAYQDMIYWKKRLGWSFPREGILSNLRGHDLACWCRLDQPCHADVLLELANGVASREDHQ